jgi:hypothetical protein
VNVKAKLTITISSPYERAHLLTSVAKSHFDFTRHSDETLVTKPKLSDLTPILTSGISHSVWRVKGCKAILVGYIFEIADRRPHSRQAIHPKDFRERIATALKAQSKSDTHKISSIGKISPC